MTSLIESDNTSFQSISDDKINCCICLDDVSNEESYMTDCKHSWCIECNKNLNKNKINKCPICKKVFKNKLDKGMWVLHKNGHFIIGNGLEEIKIVKLNIELKNYNNIYQIFGYFLIFIKILEVLVFSFHIGVIH